MFTKHLQLKIAINFFDKKITHHYRKYFSPNLIRLLIKTKNISFETVKLLNMS